MIKYLLQIMDRLTQEQQQLLLNQEDIQALQQRENELLALEVY